MKNRPILLVEDNPGDQALVLGAIKQIEIANNVIVVGDGAEALDYFFGPGGCATDTRRHLPAMVLLEIKLPKIDGIEVLRRIRADKRTSSTPVIILTASHEERDLVNGYKFGCNGYIRKPADSDQFVETVRGLGLWWLTQNQPSPDTRPR